MNRLHKNMAATSYIPSVLFFGAEASPFGMVSFPVERFPLWTNSAQGDGIGRIDFQLADTR